MVFRVLARLLVREGWIKVDSNREDKGVNVYIPDYLIESIHIVHLTMLETSVMNCIFVHGHLNS